MKTSSEKLPIAGKIEIAPRLVKKVLNNLILYLTFKFVIYLYLWCIEDKFIRNHNIIWISANFGIVRDLLFNKTISKLINIV